MTAATIESTETTATFTMPRADWFGLLDDVVPFAGDDSYIPLLITSGGTFDARVTSEHKLFSGEFGTTDKLIPEKFTDTTDIRWRPEFMDKFSRVRRGSEPIRVRFSGPNRPIRIDIGDRFTGCVMPAPTPEDDQQP